MKRGHVVVAAVIAVVAGAVTAFAQQPGFTRTPLQDYPLTIPDRHGVTARVDIEPGAQSGRHTHPGEEFAYVISGNVQLEIDGQAPKTFKAGEVFFLPAGAVHNGKNVGGEKAVMVSTFFAETGKPLTTPVK